jgi:hypothetical protein
MRRARFRFRRGPRGRFVLGGAGLLALLLACAGCEPRAREGQTAAEPPQSGAEPPLAQLPVEPAQPKSIEERSERSDEPPPAEPVPLYEHGKVSRIVDAAASSLHGFAIVDLGEAWVPYIFTDGMAEDGKPLPNAYRETYLALSRGEFPDDRHGERARDDKYLELYGIMPTLGQLRERFRKTAKLACAAELELQPLIDFQSVAVHESNAAAYKIADEHKYLSGQVQRYMKAQGVDSPERLDLEQLDPRERDRVKRYQKMMPEYLAIDAAQKRLKCEGFFKGRGRYVRGVLDWTTRDALAEFERRHRVYSWGYLGKDTLAVLRVPPAEAERRAVVRILTERAIHAAAVLEDGSTSQRDDGKPNTYKTADGKERPIPNLVGELEARLVEAFGLQTPESTLSFLESLGELPPEAHRLVAIAGPELPEYYDGDMPLMLEYDRGDVWYDFPYGDKGQELAQPVQRRPQVTVYTEHLGEKVPLARFGTTIGGWRSEQIGDAVMWKYKESPVGSRIWTEIVASPVWLPPDSTPHRELLKRKRDRKPGEPEYEVNYHEMGPSYASAYGLVAAYHREYFQRPNGTFVAGRDEGIRTHGSVDYMSIMRRHSHGCHRLHNHIAVRLMSFVLAHRPHKRKGHEPLGFRKLLQYQDRTYPLEIRQGGHVFQLAEPVVINVLEGRIRGQVKQPIAFPIPKFDEAYSAYVMPDGRAVQVRGNQLVTVQLPGINLPVAEPIDLPAPLGTEDASGAAPPAIPKPIAPGASPAYDPKAPPDPSAQAPTFFTR